MGPTGPLTGLRVVEIAGGVPAAFCARTLRGFGARTLRVEGVAGCPDVADRLTDDQRLFLVSGAERVTVSGIDELIALVDDADVVIDDNGPTMLARLGIDPATVAADRPGQVITSLSPFGLTGPRADWQATNAVQFAVGGLMALTGDAHRPPLVTGGDQALFLGGLHGFAATTVALLGRARATGSGPEPLVPESLVPGCLVPGCLVEVSLQEAAASMPELYGPMSEYETGEPVPRAGNSVRSIWGVYRCADGFAGVCCLERQTRAFFSLIGPEVAEDARFLDPLSRAEHDDELLAHVMMFMSERTKDELVALSPVHRVPFGAVRTPLELLDDEAFDQRGFFDRVDAGDGTAVMPGRPFPGLGWTPPARLGPVTPADQHDWPSRPRTDARTGDDDGPATSDDAPPRPLDGVRVLDLTMMWAGPYATKLMAEAGAEVIKIESPGAWDNIRTLVPQDPAIPDPWNSAYYFNEYNHSKKSLTLDLATDAGREVFLRLVATADVVIENYRADVLDNLGLGYDVLRTANDRIVLVSMAGFGKTGPLTHHVGFGPIIEMMSGLMSLTGYGEDDVPYKTGVSYGDPVGGLNALAAVTLSLLERDRSGQGRHIDLAQRETAATLAGPAFVAASLRGETPTHHGNRSPAFAPQGCYPAAGEDQWVVLSVRTQAEWQALAGIIGQPSSAGLGLDERRAGHDEIDEQIAEWTRTRSATEVAETLQAAGIPAGEVLDTLAIHDDAHLTARGFYQVVPHEKMDPYRQSGPTWTLHGCGRHAMVRSPLFGEHNREVLTDLGLTHSEIADLRARRVIADAPIDPGVG